MSDLKNYEPDNDAQDQTTIVRVFEAQVALKPQETALVFKNRKMTYEELNRRADQLAQRLSRQKVRPDQVVGLMVKRSFEMFIGIIAILKAGGAYLPIDPDYPEERIRFMLDDCQIDLLLTQSDLNGKVNFSREVVNLDQQETYQGAAAPVVSPAQAHNLAYIIYTSGSTGKPKGVMIEHRSVVNLTKGIIKLIDFSAIKAMLAVTTVSFDMSILETIFPLLAGLTIVIADEAEHKNPVLLSNLIINHQVDLIQMTPSRLKLFIAYHKNLHCFQRLAAVIVGGEALPETLLQNLKQLTKARIYNLYGPTETTVWSTGSDVTEATAINIGKPILNTSIYITDDQVRPVPTGETGELCIGGLGLARGYHHCPELTAAKFVTTDLPCGRVYRTGDLARWLPDGNLECLGRIDNQVKIRGFRIELGEIEERLRAVAGIAEAAVIARDNSFGDQYLCAYLVADQTLNPPDSINQNLALVLPEYMIPTKYVYLKAMPLSTNGKIDRKALMHS